MIDETLSSASFNCIQNSILQSCIFRFFLQIHKISIFAAYSLFRVKSVRVCSVLMYVISVVDNRDSRELIYRDVE